MKIYKFYNFKKELVCWFNATGVINAIELLQKNERLSDVSKYVREFELDKIEYSQGSDFIKL